MNKHILVRPAETVRMKWPANFVEDDLLEFRDQQVYTSYDAYIKEYRNVWVSPDSVMYKNGLLVKASLPATRYESYYSFKYLLKKLIKGKKITLDDREKYLLATDLWSEGHFHWFGDILPKLLCIRDKTADFVLLLQDTPYIRTIAVPSLERLKLNFRDIVFMDKTGFYKIRNLSFVSRLGQSGHFQPALMDKLRRQLSPAVAPPARRLYISRSQAHYRKVLNEEALLEMLQQYGFETVYAENLSLAEQIDVFAEANTLLSIHGAGLTNCLFMQEGGQVIELRKKENGATNVGYWHLADSLGHRFYYYNGIPDSGLPLVGRGCNITVPVEDFENSVLKKIL